MKFDYAKLGGGMMASGTAMIHLAGVKWVWWVGCIFLIAGPLLLSVRHPKKP